VVKSVTDTRSNLNDQLVYAARMIGRSEPRALVFDAVCSGKKRVKTRDEIVAKTGLSPKQVLTAGKHLAARELIEQTRERNQTAYAKDPTLAHHKRTILRLAKDEKALARVETKTAPRATRKTTALTVTVQVPRALVEVRQVTVDDITSFANVRGTDSRGTRCELPEKAIKKGFQCVVGEPGEFQDWGGEKNDLWTTRLEIEGKRHPAAFAFKGPGTTGPLTPKKMGKNGDQIQRLFTSQADVFIVQYWREMDESIVEQLRQFAIAKSAVEAREIIFGVVDGKDTCRVVGAYSKCFPG
jgi:hypothetical protein